jgi:hypothetical protein
MPRKPPAAPPVRRTAPIERRAGSALTTRARARRTERWLALKRTSVPLTASLSLAISACATPQPPPAGQRFLGQISYVATPEQANHGFFYSAKADEAIYGVVPESAQVPPATKLIAACGHDQNSDTRYALVRFYYYWFDASRSIQNFSRWTMVESSLSVERGDIVEVELRQGSSNSRCAVVNKIRATSLDEAECEYRDNRTSATFKALSIFSPAGGPGSASCYCPFIEAEGWKATSLGPASGSMGGIAWSKGPAR